MLPVWRVRRSAGFTLVELLVSIAVLLVVLVISTQAFEGIRTVISRTSGQIAEFREARNSFETLTRRIAQATLNGYDDSPPTSLAGGTKAYIRASELRFVSGNAATLIGNNGTTGTLPHPTHAVFFQAPLGYTTSSQGGTGSASTAGLIQLLNTCGYFVEWNSDQSMRPTFLPAKIPLRWRYRLMEMVEPTENLSIYNYTSGPDSSSPSQSKSWNYKGLEWFQNPLALPLVSNGQPATGTRPAHAIATNVLLLALLPMVAPQNAANPPGPAADGTSKDIAPNYYYHTAYSDGNSNSFSQNRLPPMVRVVMIAAEEQTFARYLTIHGSTDPSVNLGLTNILTDASYDQRTKDIKQVTDALSAAKINYRVFATTVVLTPN